jgi:hypothetical protein
MRAVVFLGSTLEPQLAAPMPTPSKDSIVPIGLISQKIYFVRSARVMLDADLARLYGVATKNLNKAVKRNMRRFPSDFMFQLSANEMRNLRFQIGTSRRGQGGRRYAPYVFTEQGIAMLSSVLRSARRASERRDHADLCAASRDAGNPRGVAPKNRRDGEAVRREISGRFRNYPADAGNTGASEKIDRISRKTRTHREVCPNQ